MRIHIDCCFLCFVKALLTREMWRKLPEPRARVVVKEKRR